MISSTESGVAEGIDPDDSIESLLSAHHSRHRLVFWLIFTVMLGIIIALPLVHIDVSVGAPAVVRSQQERIPLYSSVDGRISRVLVADNELVSANQTVLTIESPILDERMQYNELKRRETNERIADLKVMIAASSSAGKTADKRTVALPRLLTPAYMHQLQYLYTQLESNFIFLSRADCEYNRTKLLHTRGLVTEQALEDAQFAVDRTTSERTIIVRQHISKWQSEQLELDSQMRQLATEWQQLASQKDAHQLRAPASGDIIGIASLSAGSFLPAGTKIGEISPRGKPIVEAHVTPRDIGFVRLGQRANIQVEAFPYSEWGTLHATVSQISHDVLPVRQASRYKVTLSLDRVKLYSRSGTAVQITRGMTAHVRFITTKRSLLNLLHQRTSEWLDPTNAASNESL